MLRCGRKYDVPLYCAGWAKDGDGDGGLVVLGGGGGNGIANTLLLARFDYDSSELSKAVHSVSTAHDLPYRLAVHPGGEEMVCSCSRSCRIFSVRSGEEGVKLEQGEEKAAPQLLDLGEQCLTFATDGSMLAAGGQDGHLRVFAWPSLEVVMDEPGAHKCVKDVDFSLDGAFLASTDDSSPCRIWDLAKAAAVTVLKEDKIVFAKFSRDEKKALLYAASRGGGRNAWCSVSVWDTQTWKKVGVKRFSGNPMTAFSMSGDGKYLAIGGSEGDVCIVDTSSMVACQRVRASHMVFVTSMAFSPCGRALLSVSADSSARATLIVKSRRRGPMGVLFIIFFILSLLLYFVTWDLLREWKDHILSGKGWF